MSVCLFSHYVLVFTLYNIIDLIISVNRRARDERHAEHAPLHPMRRSSSRSRRYAQPAAAAVSHGTMNQLHSALESALQTAESMRRMSARMRQAVAVDLQRTHQLSSTLSMHAD